MIFVPYFNIKRRRESLEMTGKLFHTEKLKSYGQYENYCEAVETVL